MKNWICLLSVLGMAMAGCASATEGVVVAKPPGLAVRSVTPDVSFNTPGGKSTSLSQTRLPIAVIAFVATKGPECNRLAPELTPLSSTAFAHLPVSVVQISRPTSECPFGPGCVQVNGPGKGDVIALCDSQGVAWQAFGNPAPGTVYLINQDRQVLQIARLNDMDALIQYAVREAQQYATLHHGGWDSDY